MSKKISLSVEQAARFVAGLFERAGLAAPAAAEMGRALVEADVAGLPSHGLSQVEMYVRRLLLGSVSPASELVMVESREATAVLDAKGMFGHLAGDQAMQIAIDRSKGFGVGVVAVRNSFHFGAAGRYTQEASEQGCIGVAMCNTKPMMPAPGGIEKLVGNNPISIGLPAAEGPDFLLDMALSEAALGKIRVAEKAGSAIPPTWAIDRDGMPTTDAKAAIEGLLLPAGGPKGFGLALAVNLMCSLLSQGPGGEDVAPLYGDLSKPFLCSLLFIAIDIGHFRPEAEFRSAAAAELARIRRSKSREGALRTPGERGWAIRHAGRGRIHVPAAVVETLQGLASEVGLTDRVLCKGSSH
jgi:LDH2 family malate/lactate/ureidoglycolate dehydrogenase